MYLSELKSIIHAGYLIKMKLEDSDFWHYHVIDSVYNDIIAVKLRNTSEEARDLIQKPVLIKVACQNTEYVSTGTILDVSGSEPLHAKIKFTDVDKYTEKRRFERFLTNLGCNLKVAGEDYGTFSTIQNICFTGCYLNSNINCLPDSKIRMDIINNNNQVLSLNGKITRKDIQNNKFGYGIVFANNDNGSLQILKSFIESFEELELSMIKEWQHIICSPNADVPADLKVLIIDDIKFTRTYIRNSLAENGISNIFEASNGNEALQKISALDPDIITLDLSMPGIDGIETLKHIKSMGLKTRTIIISAFIDDNAKHTLLSLGAEAIIEKPFEQSQIINAVARILKE